MSIDSKIIKLLQTEFLNELSSLLEELTLCNPELLVPQTRNHALKKIFRIIHTIKSSSRAIGFDTLGSVAHELENSLAVLRVHPQRLDQLFIDQLIKATAAFEDFSKNPILQFENLLNDLKKEYLRIENSDFDSREFVDPIHLVIVEKARPIKSNSSIKDFGLFMAIAKKVAHDTATALGKPIEFFEFGGSTQAPEKIIKALSGECLEFCVTG